MAENGERHSILCPNCRRLISTDEPSCPYCGIRNPGSRWRNNFLTRSLASGDQTIRLIMYLCGGMYVLSLLISPRSLGFGMNPLSFLSPGDGSLLLLGETGAIPIRVYHRWWTVISAIYLHGSVLHILFNMMALRQLGPLVVQEFGPYRMFSIYTLTGIFGYLVSYFAGIPYTVGASGAVCGLIGALFYYGKSRGGAFGQMIYQQTVGWVVSLFIFGFLFRGVIDNWAHGGGLLGGIILGFLLGYQERIPENSFHKLLGAACIVATLATLAWAVLTTIGIIISR